jgi:hypothetical protein
MAFALNLRGDIAKLSDAELAARLDAAFANCDSAYRKPTQFKLWYSRRGIIRHPWAYRFLSIVGIRGPGFTQYLGLVPFLGAKDCYNQHLALCEIGDLNDEIERRILQKRGRAR